MNETNAVGQAVPAEDYTASINTANGRVYISVPSIALLQTMVGLVRTALGQPASFPTIEAAGVTAAEKQAAGGAQKPGKPDSSAGEKRPGASATAGSPPATASAGDAGNGTPSGVQQSAAPADKPSSAKTEDAASVTYDDVAKAVRALYAKSPAETEKIVKGQFGAKGKASDIPADKWPALIDALKAKLGELEEVPA